VFRNSGRRTIWSRGSPNRPDGSVPIVRVTGTRLSRRSIARCLSRNRHLRHHLAIVKHSWVVVAHPAQIGRIVARVSDRPTARAGSGLIDVPRCGSQKFCYWPSNGSVIPKGLSAGSSPSPGHYQHLRYPENAGGVVVGRRAAPRSVLAPRIRVGAAGERFEIACHHHLVGKVLRRTPFPWRGLWACTERPTGHFAVPSGTADFVRVHASWDRGFRPDRPFLASRPGVQFVSTPPSGKLRTSRLPIVSDVRWP